MEAHGAVFEKFESDSTLTIDLSTENSRPQLEKNNKNLTLESNSNERFEKLNNT